MAILDFLQTSFQGTVWYSVNTYKLVADQDKYYFNQKQAKLVWLLESLKKIHVYFYVLGSKILQLVFYEVGIDVPSWTMSIGYYGNIMVLSTSL